MIRLVVITFFISLAATGYGQIELIRQKQFNVKNNLALEGYDPVSYFNSAPKEGKASISYTHKGITYRFSTEANRTKFRASPDSYEPAYGGWCAYAMGNTGEKVKVDPETYKIVEGRLYLFYNFWTTNTLEDWNKNEKKLKEAGDRNWRKIVE